MKKSARIAAFVAAAILGGRATAQEFADLNKPITLDLGIMPFVTSLEPNGGWSLTIRMLANKPIGIGVQTGFTVPTGPGQTAYIIWTDPDGKFSLGCSPKLVGPFNPGYSCPVSPTDETYLEFTSGLPAKAGTGSPPSKVNTWDWANRVGNTTDPQTSVGPAAGYGASPAVPGLVILSDTGVGRDFVPDAAYGIHQTGAARNLAGFVNSVSWTINDRMPLLPRTSVTAEMNVPYGLFMPILFADRNGKNGVTNYQWTIDGGPVASGGWDQMMTALNAKVTTVRIFVLDGAAPDHFDDMNGDGKVDSRDALLTTNSTTGMKFKLLSGERVIRFQTLVQDDSPGIDFDFNGDGMTFPVAPPGGGTVVKIPK